MAFLKVGKAVQQKQRLYLLEITMPSGLVVCKIGKASGPSSVARMMQIVESIYNTFRKTPMIYKKRDAEVDADKVFQFESCLHRFFKNYRYETKHKWSGCTEAFVIPLADATMAFDAVIGGQTPDHVYEMPKIEEDKLPF